MSDETSLTVTATTDRSRDPHWKRAIQQLTKAAKYPNERVVVECFGARLVLAALGIEVPPSKQYNEHLPEPLPGRVM